VPSTGLQFEDVRLHRRRRRRGARALRLTGALGLPALVLQLAGAAGPARAADLSLARVQQAGVLRWGGDVQGGEPYVFEDPARPGTLVGFEVEIAEGLARQLGVRAEFVQNDWSMLVPTLERGTVDIAMNGLEVTEARRRRVRFSAPYFVFAERLTVRAGERGIRDLAGLRGRRAGTLASTLAWDLLGDVGADRVPYEGTAEPYRDLASGRLDAVLMDDIIADRYGRLPGLVVAGDVARGQYAIAVRPADQALAAAVDRALARLIATGELRAVLRRWRLDGPQQDAVLGPAVAAAGAEPAGAPATRAGRLTARQVGLFVHAAVITLALSAAAMAIAMALGLALALARLPSRLGWRRALARAATVYVELFRGTPLLLQLYLLYFGLAPFYPLHPVAAAILGLGLNYAAYEAEIYRAGLQAVPRGQIEAAEALGMPGAMVLRRVVLPQALRFSLPGVSNDFIALLKDSSLVSVITVVELTKRMNIAAVDAGGWLLPGLLCAGLYLAMSYPLSRLARRLERALGPRT
jgi:polar amino acid transport system substrate-binding protein